MLNIKDFSFREIKKDTINWVIVDFDKKNIKTKFQEWTLEELDFIK